MAETLAWNFVGNDEITGLLSKMDRLIEKLDRDFTGMGRSAKTAAAGLATTEKAADGLGDELDRAARKADDLAGELDGVRRAGGQLDVQIAITKAQVQALAAEFDKTGDKDLFARMREERGALAGLERIKKELRSLDDVGADVGKGMLGGIMDAFGALPAQLKGATMVAAGLLVAATGPLIGAAVSAAVVGGVGAGGMIGGIALAAQDSRVKNAAQKFAAEVGAAFDPIGEQFVRPVIDALDILADAAKDFAGNLDLGPIADQVPQLAQGMRDFAEAIGPGLNKAFKAAGPILNHLARELPELGDAFGDMLSQIADEPGVLLGFIAALELVEMTVRGVGFVLSWLAARFEEIVVAGAAFTGFMEDIPLFGQIWKGQNDHLEEMLTKMRAAGGPLAAFADGFADIGGEADSAATNIDMVSEALDGLFGRWMSLDEAKVRAEEAIDAVGESFGRYGKSLDINTEAGQRNHDQLLRSVEALKNERDAMIKSGATREEADAHFAKQFKRLMDEAVAHGAVRSELEKVIGKYRDLINQPASITKTIKFLSDTTGYNPPATGRRQYAYAEGGTVGPGLPVGTPVGILAHAGEVVLPQDLAERIMALGGGSQPRPASAALPALATAGGGASNVDLAVNLNVDGDSMGRVTVRSIQRYAATGGYPSLEALFGIPATA